MFNEKQFKEFVDSFINEYNRENGEVEIEFATSYAYLAKKRAILNAALKQIRPFTWVNYWNIFPCAVCKSYHANKPYHVILERTDWN